VNHIEHLVARAPGVVTEDFPSAGLSKKFQVQDRLREGLVWSKKRKSLGTGPPKTTPLSQKPKPQAWAARQKRKPESFPRLESGPPAGN
jgi:hypothetical protein